MSKKASASALTAVVLAIIAIALAVFIGKTYTALPDGTKEFRSIVDGCSAMSESKVKDSYGRSTFYSVPSLVGCTTIDDYLKACGMKFGYMQDGGTTDKVYFVSAVKEPGEYDEWLSLFGSSGYTGIHAVVGADYTNADGEKKTAYEDFYAIYSESGNGIITIEQG